MIYWDTIHDCILVRQFELSILNFVPIIFDRRFRRYSKILTNRQKPKPIQAPGFASAFVTFWTVRPISPKQSSICSAQSGAQGSSFLSRIIHLECVVSPSDWFFDHYWTYCIHYVFVVFLGNNKDKLVPVRWFRLALRHFVEKISRHQEVSDDHCCDSTVQECVAIFFVLSKGLRPAFTVISNTSIHVPEYKIMLPLRRWYCQQLLKFS